jgi:hypothetical protein
MTCGAGFQTCLNSDRFGNLSHMVLTTAYLPVATLHR